MNDHVETQSTYGMGALVLVLLLACSTTSEAACPPGAAERLEGNYLATRWFHGALPWVEPPWTPWMHQRVLKVTVHAPDVTHVDQLAWSGEIEAEAGWIEEYPDTEPGECRWNWVQPTRWAVVNGVDTLIEAHSYLLYTLGGDTVHTLVGPGWLYRGGAAVDTQWARLERVD